MGIWDYQGTYKGHSWNDPQEELRFARSDLEHAYQHFLNVELTSIGVSKAKIEMDQAMDRLMGAVRRILDAPHCNNANSKETPRMWGFD